MSDTKLTNGHQCFHCGANSVYWQNDFNFEDFGYEGEGIVQLCHCYNCGADIEYRVPLDPDPSDESKVYGIVNAYSN